MDEQPVQTLIDRQDILNCPTGFSRGDEWKSALRTNAIEWSVAPEAMPIPLDYLPGIYQNGKSERSRADISYIRSLINKREPNIP